MPSFSVLNFGCRAAQADGAALEALLKDRGLTPSEPRHANFIILNSCTVTASADADARAAIRKAQRESPGARILVTGCYAQRAPEEIATLPGVEWVVGNARKSLIPDLLTSYEYHGGIHTSQEFASSDFLTAPVIESLSDRARPNFKIQDGCSNRCSFCVIPSVRGRSRYLPADQVVAQVRELSQRYREVIFTGINLGRWGRSAGSEMPLAGLLRRILEETPIERIRLSSVEPMDWSDELIGLMSENPRIAPHVHMPLQSGSDAILRLMRRKYRPRHYADRLWKAFRSVPDAAIGADVMTGFPGETDVHFRESLEFIESLPFTYLHVFTYSERPGTEATSLPGVVPVQVRRERTRILREVSERKHAEFLDRMSGRTFRAVTLVERPFALTGNNIRVAIADWPGPNVMVKATVPTVPEASASLVQLAGSSR